MKRLFWLGIFSFSFYWLYSTSLYFKRNVPLALVFLFFGLAFILISFQKNKFNPIDWKFLILLIPPLLLFFFIDYLFLFGILFFSIVIIISNLTKSNKLKKIERFLPGLFISSIILSIQAIFYPLFYLVSSRNYNLFYLPKIINTISNLFGLDTFYIHNGILLGEIKNTFFLNISLANLGIYFFAYMLIGSAILFVFSNKKIKFIGFIIPYFLLILIYSVLRYIFLFPLLIESFEFKNYFPPYSDIYGILYDPEIILISFIPFVFLLMKYFPIKNLNLNLEYLNNFKLNRNRIISIISISLCFFLLIGGYTFQDPGIKKEGRILIDEFHSNWEVTYNELNTTYYGELSTYNYYSWVEWMKHHYKVDINLNSTLKRAVLDDYDILILKCPTTPYTEKEINSIISYVKNGGGLFLIGDHTDVFGMNSNLNRLAKHFGIIFNRDSIHTHNQRRGFYKYHTSDVFFHPILKDISDFQFMTSCSISAPILSENVMIAENVFSEKGTYSTKDFFQKKEELTNQNRGNFLVTVAKKESSGRVVAFGDSTVFSNFCVFMDGYTSFTHGVLDYLNRENSPVNFNYIFFIFGCLLGGISFFYLKNEKKIIVILIVILFIFTSFLLSNVTYKYINIKLYSVNDSIDDFNENRVSFYIGKSSCEISPIPPTNKNIEKANQNSYNTFFVWTQRIGLIPSLSKSIDSSINSGDLIVIINPNKPFKPDDIKLISEYLKNGGNLLVMDSIYNSESTVNTLLNYFDIHIKTTGQSNLIDRNQSTFADHFNDTRSNNIINPCLSIYKQVGNLSNSNVTYLSSVKRGKGKIIVFVDSYTFSDAIMGGVFNVPNSKQKNVYNLQYNIFNNILSKNQNVN